MSQTWSEVSKELHRRRDILVSRAHDKSFPMNDQERTRIRSVLEFWETPPRPADIPTLMKQFCVSAFSYAPLRNNFMAPLAGGLPTIENIAAALSKAFNKLEFLDNSYWVPEGLGLLATVIQKEHCLDLSSRQFPPRVVSVLISGGSRLQDELGSGLDSFYDRISRVTAPLAMWDLVNEFSRSISYVGPALVCDFFKEIGFAKYVKVDHHFGRQFPSLVNPEKGCRFSVKKSFILSQEVANSIEMTPYHLDAILYLWGRYGDRA